LCNDEPITISAKAAFATYQWSNNSSNSALTISQPGLYWLAVMDKKGCQGKDSITITVKNCPKGIYFPTAFTPDNNGNNDSFGPLVYGNVVKFKFTVFNRWGQIVFRSADFRRRWDGNFNGFRQDGNVFVWVCEYQFDNTKPELKKGVVTLIR
jgi:gliding motility-associated-like protein